LAGCISVGPRIELPENVSISNVTIVVGEQNASLPSLQDNVSITIANAPDNLTVCIVGNQTSASDELFYGNFTFASRSFSFHQQYYDGYASLGECHLLVYKNDEGVVFVSRSQRARLVKSISDGVSLLFSELALSKVKEDPTVDGWEFLVKDAIPVKSSSVAHELVTPALKNVSKTFKFRVYYGAWEGFKNFNVENLLVFEVLPSDDAIAVADFSDSPTGESDIAVLAKHASPLSGRVIYFSFDAFDSSDLRIKSLARQAAVFLLQDFLRKRFIV